MWFLSAIGLLFCAVLSMPVSAFEPDNSEQPPRHPPLAPADAAVASTNPPSMIWRVDERAASYVLEMCQRKPFDRKVIRIDGIDMPFYNHSAELAHGVWYWRYFVVASNGERSSASPTRSFVIDSSSIPLPIPATKDILARMPAHPRVFVTPDTLPEFRARKDGPGREAWEDLQYRVKSYIRAEPRKLKLGPMPERPREVRGRVFYLKDGRPWVPANYSRKHLNADAAKANALSFAYLVSGDEQYAQAAKRWALFVSDFRVDYHLEDRAQHDTVVYCYEYGLKGMALAFDRIYDLLSEAERDRIIQHVEYHGENAYRWCRDRRKLHLDYQNSHGQQCMHALFTTTLALATDSARAGEWFNYLVRQYVNRVAWGSDDGGYSEGQKYGHKVQFILEAMAALRTATGIDLFVKPRWRNTGEFWLYCMSLNYWWNHWGDCYSLIDADFGSGADTYLTGFLASLTGKRHVKWYSDTRICNPAHLPFWYLSSSRLRPKPPIDIPQAKLFGEAGQLAAYDRFYDHHGNRIFFRSSRWGSHSHAHCDQNGFIIHVGGEIMACDAGYYTYCGDTYHNKWSRATQAHNSILVNGQGQPRGIDFKGSVPAFFNSPTYCLFIGDASGAYGDGLNKFDRAVLFVRPDVFVVYDELSAAEPSSFTWVLNAFEAADIDAAAHRMVVRQRDQRLSVHHVAPERLEYAQTNERPFPIKDPKRKWSRYTEAFPQPWNIRVTTAEAAADQRILAFMHAYDGSDGPRVTKTERLDVAGALGVRAADAKGSETTLFRPRQDAARLLSANGIETDGRIVSVGRNAVGEIVRWLLLQGTRLAVDGKDLWRSEVACDAAADFGVSSAGAQVCLQHSRALSVAVWLPNRPGAVLCAPANGPARPQSLKSTWRGSVAEIDVPSAGETVLWIDPAFSPSAPLDPIELLIEDSTGRYSVALESARSDNGEVVAFGTLSPREPGLYEVAGDHPETDLLVQDRWDPVLSKRGRSKLVATLRDGAEVFVRYAAGEVPVVRARLRESHRGRIICLLRNGGFEEGIPDYPPRGWNVRHPRTGDLGWPEWSREAAAGGGACLRFVRPKDPISLRSQPMRLRTEGRYVLRFKAKGSATVAKVIVAGQRGTRASLPIAPSLDWQEYRTELNGHPGYCTITISLGKGGEPNQVLWVDDMEFGYVGGGG